MVTLTFDGSRFLARVTYENRHVPREAGFRFDPDEKIWYTTNGGDAFRLREFADWRAKRKLAQSLVSFSPWTGCVPFPAGLDPRPYQLRAAEYALSRNRSYLALEQGLGKTIVAALIRNATLSPMLYVCPPFLVSTVQEEFLKWTGREPMELTHEMLGTRNLVEDLVIVRDDVIAWYGVKEWLLQWADSRGATLIVDEAHRYCGDLTLRTNSLLTDRPGEEALIRPFARVVFMSGTPMTSRPIDLWPILNSAFPEATDFRDKDYFGGKYCAAKWNGFGVSYAGASNLDTLREKLKPFMLRMEKKDVLPDLPPKSEEVVFIGENVPPVPARMERELLAHYSPEDLLTDLAPNGHVATYRKELGKWKAADSISMIEDALATESKVLVFAVHKEVVKILAEGLKKYRPVVVTGDTPSRKRKERVTMFQTDARKRVFLGNVQAAGVGFTLTKAARVIMVEYSWVPAENDQAADRAHRFGQDREVHVQYLAYRNSKDRKVLETILRKRANINQVLKGN